MEARKGLEQKKPAFLMTCVMSVQFEQEIALLKSRRFCFGVILVLNKGHIAFHFTDVK